VAAGASELGEGRSGSRSTRRRTRQGSTEPAVIGGRRRRKGARGRGRWGQICVRVWVGLLFFGEGGISKVLAGTLKQPNFFSILTFLFIFQK
jgi:hypothetical protein